LIGTDFSKNLKIQEKNELLGPAAMIVNSLPYFWDETGATPGAHGLKI
jgi:hypothetical protein